MGSELDIQMKQFNGTDYDNLFPKTKGTLVEGIYTADETLTNDVKGLYGLGANATPDEIFRTIYNKFNLIASNLAQISVTVQTTNGNKLQGIVVDNIFDADGNPVSTNVNGVATGFVNAGKISIGVTQYADITNLQKTIEAGKGQTYSETLSVTPRNFLKITTSRNVMFTNNVSRVDVTAVGGGGGGSGGWKDPDHHSAAPGAGGGGGHSVIKESVSFSPFIKYSAVVGKGGTGGSAVQYGDVSTPSGKGGTGGSSSFLGVSATGGGGGGASGTDYGNGGVGNGRGGKPRAKGNVGTESGYSSFTQTIIYGGGGAGGRKSVNDTVTGGGYGGSDGKKGQDGFGGGGAGGFSDSDNRAQNGAAGGSGCIAIRMHLKAT